MRKMDTHNTFWLQHSRAIVNRQQGQGHSRRSTHKLLQEADVEHIMDTGAFQEGEMDSNICKDHRGVRP